MATEAFNRVLERQQVQWWVTAIARPHLIPDGSFGLRISTFGLRRRADRILVATTPQMVLPTVFMKPWIFLALIAGSFAGCESTDGLQAISPVQNEVRFTGTYVPAGEVDQPPVVTDQTSPDFPAAMRRARIDGKVIMALIVGENGRAEQIQVEQATHPLFAEAALAAVRHWRFKPAIKNGRPVASSFSLPIEFRRDTSTDPVPR